MSEVIDLSDLVKAVEFKVESENFNIPPIPDDKLKSIMKIANKITEAGKDGMLNEDANEEFIQNQNQFLAMAVQKKEGKNFKKMEQGDFSTWPLKLKNRVMELVFQQIGTSSGEEVSAEAEKN